AAGAANNRATVIVPVIHDDINEENETVIVTLGAPPTVTAAGGTVTRAAAMADYTGTGTINDDDDLTVAILATSGSVNEGGDAAFRISLSGGTSQNDVSVTLAFGGTATGGADASSNPDYITPATTFTIAADQTSNTLTIPLRYDRRDTTDANEADPETLTVTVSAPTARGVTVSTATAQINVNNIDAARGISVAGPGTVGEGADIEFTVTIDGEPVREQFSLAWTLGADADNATDDATLSGSGADISTATTGTLTVPVSSDRRQRLTVTVLTVDDSMAEDDEVLTLTLTDPCAGLNPSGAGGCNFGGRPAGGAFDAAPAVSVDTSPAAATIGQSDQPVTVAIAAPAGDLTEGTAANFAVSFPESVTTTAGVTVTYAVSFPAASSSVNPAAAADFSAPLTGLTVTIPAGMATVNLALTAMDDAIHEADEDFTVTLTGVSGGGAIATPSLHAMPSASAKIAASDPVTVSIVRAGSATPVVEGGTAEFTVSLALTAGGATATSGADICVMFGTAVSQQMTANTAGQGADISVTDCAGAAQTVAPATGVASGGARIVAGQSSATLAIGARYDNYDEGATAETVTVTVSSAADEDANFTYPAVTIASNPNNAASVDITNVNAARSVSVAAPSGTVAENAGSLTFTVTVVGEPVTQSFQIPWTITAGSATVSGANADIGSSTSGMVTVPISSNRMQELTIPVTVVDDSTDEDDETIMLALTDICSGRPASGAGGCNFGGRPAGGAFDSAPAVVVSTTAATA
ncbi:MAG: hypothetical protein OXU61_11190, partial [Gammaproteobacteria bacterium]|nr:hypothetical protein [Gammaproteobacteria bacterium]